MRKVIVPLFLAIVAGAGFAADVPQPETPGSAGPQAYAEMLREARIQQSGRTAFNPASQPVAQAAGDRGAQETAEAIHVKKTHGSVNQSADQRLELDHPNH